MKKIFTIMFAILLFAFSDCGSYQDNPTFSLSDILETGNGYIIVKCPTCYGCGYVQCFHCNGLRYTQCSICEGEIGNDWCEECHGEGKVECNICGNEGLLDCSDCNGSGKKTYYTP